ncbi:hypothetical protein AAES_21287 [Amazona aestiva]|uniref:Uncharacterized protein n=1 Tax=Amazona aestiva TaxID=12930 RepID=A0A0Q3X694_AMAAE|nr:hypothetical protein AAES_21287 [Amazona aestiva]
MDKAALGALVEILLQQGAELQESVDGLRDIREAERKLDCLLQAQAVQGPQASNLAQAEKAKDINPGSWELAAKKIKPNKKRRKRTIKSNELPPKPNIRTQNTFTALQGANRETPTTPKEQPVAVPVKRITTGSALERQCITLFKNLLGIAAFNKRVKVYRGCHYVSYEIDGFNMLTQLYHFTGAEEILR